MAPGGKHSPNRVGNYFEIHNTRMHQHVLEGFVREDTLELSTLPDGILMTGELPCLGGLRIEVRKKLKRLDGGAEPLVRTVSYSYNVSVAGVGVVFRYDSPHPFDGPDYHGDHHKHVYDVLGGDREGRVEIVPNEEAIPTLSEVIDEAREWYYANRNKLDELGLL